MQMLGKKCGYLRLSVEDGDVMHGSASESCSISLQRQCIEQYLAEHTDLAGEYEEIIDDGYSGTNMNRPGMQHLLRMISAGEVSTVIVRDLSRFARDYLEAGHYLEYVFPAMGVRFISINEEFDSENLGEDTGGLELAIRNLINQMYSRDISRKIKSVVDMKKFSGAYVYGAVPYGYKKVYGKSAIEPDASAAEIVARIFDFACEGHSITDIAKRLNTDSVPTPSMYLSDKRGKYPVRNFWSYESVRNILINRIYTGDTEPFKSHVVKVGSKRVKQIPEEERLVIPNTHEPIVSREAFYQARETIRKTAPKSRRIGAGNMLQPYLTCAHCGKHLAIGKKGNRTWRCTSSRYVPDSCCKDTHIEDAKLQEVILHAVQTQLHMAEIRLQKIKQQSISEKSVLELLQREQKRLLNKLERAKQERMELYEHYVCGKLSKEDYQHCKNSLSNTLNQIETQIGSLSNRIADETAKESNREAEVRETRSLMSYELADQLTPALLREMVKRIVVISEDSIRIEWNFSSYIPDNNDNLAF